MSFQKEGHSLKAVLAASLITLLLVIALPASAHAANNPSPEEISQKFDIVAAKYQIPSEILKAIAFAESGWRQFDSNGRTVMGRGSRPAIGIMQICSYNAGDTATINALKNDIDFNIAYGAQILQSKWDSTPQIGDGDKAKLENWYFALWAYNGWTTANNPQTAAARGRVPYQDKILKYMNSNYYGSLTPAVNVTPIPRSQVAAGTLPKKTTTWRTPEPVHLGTMTVLEQELSRGGGNALDTVGRIGGVNRIDTAAKVALTGWPAGSPVVILAQEDDFADALAAVPLSKKFGAPILLTKSDSLDRRAESAIQFLNPSRIIMLGGALSFDVEAKIKEVLPDTEVDRIAGEDRYETAALIASYFPEATTVAIASGDAYPDALSLAEAAAVQGCPILLSRKDVLPDSTRDALAALNPSAMVIVGGDSLLSPAVLDAALGAAGLAREDLNLYAASDRYETAALIMSNHFPVVGKVFIASGENLSDVLVGAALAAQQSVPLLLAPKGDVKKGSTLETYLRSLPAATEIEVLGGVANISDETLAKIRALLGN